MIEIIGFPYTHVEQVSIRQLAKLNPQTGKVPVARFDVETTYDSTLILRRFDKVQPERPVLADWYKRVEDARHLDGGTR